MWDKTDQSISSGDNSTNLLAGENIFYTENIPTGLVDQKIHEEVDKLRKSRFFSEFKTVESSWRLAKQLAEGELSGGSCGVRGPALAWCVRLLSLTEDIDQVAKLLKLAKTLGDFSETKIAEAFVLSRQGEKAEALQTIAEINSSVSRSAGFMIVSHHDGPEGALNWMNDAGFTVDNLDPDGKSTFLKFQLQLGHWDEITKTVDALSKTDLNECPILHFLTALSVLLPLIPIGYRNAVVTYVPFDTASYPLAADANAMSARHAARTHFLDAAEAAKKLDCLRSARIAEEYALWLELRDPEQREFGISRLESKLAGADRLGFVHYALQFGVKLDLDLVEREINQSVAINGGMTSDAALARFTLAFTKSTPEEIANYIDQHYTQLASHIDNRLIQLRQIEMLSRAGLMEKANEIFDRLLEEGISADQEKSLRGIISEAQASDPTEFRKAQYEETKNLTNLINLVAELEEHKQWDDLCKFGRTLFEETHSLIDAERLVNAYNNTSRSKALVSFLKEYHELLSQSSHLRMSYAWGLYHEGEFLDCRKLLAEIGDDLDDPNYRTLQIELGIASGDWASLSDYINNEYRDRENRNAHELIEAAQLALRIGSPHAKDLLFLAASKANENPGILSTAYFTATGAGWEDDPQVAKWLEQAVKLSGDEGPIQKMSLQDVLDQKPEWDRRESETWRMLAQGQIPIFVAAQSFNRTLLSLTAFQAMTNLKTVDPRSRSLIPAFSGKREPVDLEITGKTVALDATALTTLSFLNILDAVLDTIETVYIPHTTLVWLFEERQKAAFHQPSRIANAHEILDLLASDMLEKFIPSTTPNSDLSAYVGDELATLIAEAEKVRDEDDSQHLVVRPAPVHRISSLLEEEADLTEHEAVLCSCLSVVDKLKQKGRLTAKEEKHARAFLQLREKQWPSQPEIADGATLYLDDLSISYFQDLGLLGKLKAAGLRAIVSPREFSEANSFISYEQISGEVKDTIERMRTALNSRIETGHIKVGSINNIPESRKKLLSIHPSESLFSIAHQCDAVIVDDRCFNQHANIDMDGTIVPLFSTIDLLDAMVKADVLSDDDCLEHRTRLRQAGYCFIPVNEAELERLLIESPIIDGQLIETAELKAIRESVLRVRMSDWLQLPEEAAWLDGTLKVFVHVLRNLWVDEANIEETIVRSNWLVEHVDIRGWAHRLIPEHADNIVQVGRAVHILLLLSPTTDNKDIKKAYWNWVEKKILAPLQEQFPEVYMWLVDWYRNHVVKLAKTHFAEDNYSPEERSDFIVMSLDLIPPLIQDSLIHDQSFREEYGIKIKSTITFEIVGISFVRSELFDAVRIVLDNQGSVELIDTKNTGWNLINETRNGELPRPTLESDRQRLELPDYSVLSGNASIRIRSLKEAALDVNLPYDAQEEWQHILEKRALEDEEVDSFYSDMRNTPSHVAQIIQRELSEGKSSISSLVPSSRLYFERLVGTYDGSTSIQDYAANTGRGFVKQLLDWQLEEGFLLSLLLSSHSALTSEINIDHLSPEELEKAYGYMENHGDLLSKIGALEIGLRILPDRPEVEPFLLRLVDQIRDDDIEGEASEFKVFSALFVLVDGELSRTRIFAKEPPFYRRLASLAQAALIHRQLVGSGLDYSHFCEWAFSYSGERFYMQTFADMRTEPRWAPDLAAASQLQADFVGRIMIAGHNYQANLGSGELYDVILGYGEKSLISLFRFPLPFLPGPLEGKIADNQNALPDDITRIIEEQLNKDEVEATSFIALVNSALTFKIPIEHAELAAKALKVGNYTLANLKDKSELVSILSGLATVAAVSRNKGLADEIRILVRRYRRDSQYALSIEEAMMISLVTSAAKEELMEWREFAGEWLTELAFEEMEVNEVGIFHSHLLALLHSVPEMWVSCAKADAALQALRTS